MATFPVYNKALSHFSKTINHSELMFLLSGDPVLLSDPENGRNGKRRPLIPYDPLKNPLLCTVLIS